MAGMSESDFWANEPWTVLNRINAWSEIRSEKEKSDLRQLSILGAWVLAPHAKKGKQPAPEKLIPSVWADVDEVKKTGPLSPEEKKARFAKHDELIRKHFEKNKK